MYASNCIVRSMSIGFLMLGLAGPSAATLFDRGGGLIYDSALDITWLQDANYGYGSSFDSIDGTTDGRMRWVNALAWAESLTYYDSVRSVTYDDWRLPAVGPVNGIALNLGTGSYDGSTDNGHNISAPGSAFPGSTGSEMAHLYYNSLDNKSYCAISTSCLPAPPQPGWGLVNTGPFINLSGAYWSSVEAPDNTAAVFFVFSADPSPGLWDSDVGGQLSFSKDSRIYAFAVRDGDVAAIPEPATSGLLLAGLAAIGVAARQMRVRR